MELSIVAAPFIMVVRKTLLFVEFSEVGCNHLVSNGVVLQVTLDVRLIARHVDKTMTREVEEDHLLLASLLALFGFTDGSSDGVTTLRSRDDTFGTGEQHASLESFELWNVNTMHQTVFY